MSSSPPRREANPRYASSADDTLSESWREAATQVPQAVTNRKRIDDDVMAPARVDWNREWVSRSGRGVCRARPRHGSRIPHSPFTSHTSRLRRLVICLDDADLHAPELHGGALTIGFEDLELDTLKYPRAANVTSRSLRRAPSPESRSPRERRGRARLRIRCRRSRASRWVRHETALRLLRIVPRPRRFRSGCARQRESDGTLDNRRDPSRQPAAFYDACGQSNLPGLPPAMRTRIAVRRGA